MTADLTPADALRVMRDQSVIAHSAEPPNWPEIRTALARVVPLYSDAYETAHTCLCRALRNIYYLWRAGQPYSQSKLQQGLDRAVSLAEGAATQDQVRA